jgi:hypothetical protein
MDVRSPRPSPPLRRGERVEGVGGCNTFSGGDRLPEGRAEFLFQCGVRWEGALRYFDPDDQHVIGLAALGFGFCKGLLKQGFLFA